MWIEASLKDTQAVCVCAHHGATLSLCLFNGTFMLCDVATYCLSHLTCLSLYEDLRKWRKEIDEWTDMIVYKLYEAVGFQLLKAEKLEYID